MRVKDRWAQVALAAAPTAGMPHTCALHGSVFHLDCRAAGAAIPHPMQPPAEARKGDPQAANSHSVTH
jgi:hypothetical protein